MKNRTISMGNNEKLVQLFGMLCNEFNDTPLGKKVTQKMFYFFERKGIPLNLRYGIHFYGPYSNKLDNAMHYLESEDYICIDTTGITHVITLGNNKINNDVLSDEETKIAKEVLNYFSEKTPLELEALATMDYIANSLLKTNNEEVIIKSFKLIKGDKFNDTIIEKSFNTLKDLKFIS